MTTGLTSAGLVIKAYAEIQSDFNAFYQGIYGNPNLNPDSVIGRRIAAQSKLLADIWALIQLIYNAPFISLTDEGSVDNTLGNEGATRLPALPTVINKAICAFSGAGTIAAGKLISNSAGFQFAAASDIVAVHDIVHDTWGAVGEFICTATGANPAPVGDSYSIVTPVTNWSGVTISSDADAVTLGRDIETLAEARLRYVDSVGIAGAGTLAALQANLNNIGGVTAKILENITDTTDVNGLPPHSISVIVQGTGSDAEKALIASTIWDKRAGGIQGYADPTGSGYVAATVVDSNGDNQTVKFSYVTALNIPAVVTYLLFSEETPPADIHTAINAVIDAQNAAFKPGEDVLFGRVLGALYQIPGIKTITLTLSGSNADIPVTISQIAVIGHAF